MATIPEQAIQETVPKGLPSKVADWGRKASPETVARLRLLWEQRRFLFRVSVYGFVIFVVIAFLIPKQYQSTTQLMPPDDQSGSPVAMAAALAGKVSGSLAGVTGDILGLKSSGDLFIGILRSRTVQDDLINKLNLRK